MTDALSWFATAATIGGALLTASNLGARVTGSGFVVFLIGSIAWLAVGATTGQQALTWTNAVLTLLNLFGIWRWLGRQAAMEQGARVAAETSEALPTQSLFPASALTGGKLVDRTGAELGTCIDAMLDRQSGRPIYLVVSEGGLAGAGETLRRLPWSFVQAGEGGFATRLSKADLAGCQAIDRDQWPGR